MFIRVVVVRLIEDTADSERYISSIRNSVCIAEQNEIQSRLL